MKYHKLYISLILLRSKYFAENLVLKDIKFGFLPQNKNLCAQPHKTTRSFLLINSQHFRRAHPSNFVTSFLFFLYLHVQILNIFTFFLNRTFQNVLKLLHDNWCFEQEAESCTFRPQSFITGGAPLVTCCYWISPVLCYHGDKQI